METVQLIELLWDTLLGVPPISSTKLSISVQIYRFTALPRRRDHLGGPYRFHLEIYRPAQGV